ncbi:hypothetical protein BHE74_00047051 [Ensete ventricosum]|nr:hypothetical protein BHE74_00047051 [Ensete ventricosum]
MGISGAISGGPEIHPLYRRGPSRSRLTSSSGAWRLEGTAHQDGRPTHGALWKNTLTKPTSPISPSRQERLNTLAMVTRCSTLTKFTGDSIAPLGMTVLPVTLGQEPRSKTMMVTFMVVGLQTAYNIILGWPTLNRLKAYISTYHCAIKFSTRARVEKSGATHGSQGIAT